MKSIKEVSVWEVKKRLQMLEKFLIDVTRYFSNSEYSLAAHAMIEQPEAKEARSAINLTLDEVHDLIRASGVVTMIAYHELPVQGGRSYPVDVIVNLFECYNYNKRPDDVIGLIERSIGTHQSEIPRAWRRTLNPFWWFRRRRAWMVSPPIGSTKPAGAEASSVQQPGSGILANQISGLIGTVAALLTIFHLLGLMNWLQTVLGTVFLTNPG